MTAWLPGPVLVAGPCALEDDALNLRIGDTVAAVAAQLGLRAFFKGSFDKANRSSVHASRGIGLGEGLRALEGVRDATGLPVLTDVHDPSQVEPVAQVADCLQIPAMLCRQTDLLVAAGSSGKPVNIKKGPWMAASEMTGAVEKVRSGGCTDVAVTERGTVFGYGDLVVDMRNFPRLREATAAAVLFDATHAVQRPGMGRDGTSGGDRAAIPALLRAAAAAGADGFFIETHPDPERAPSDGATMWPLDQLASVVEEALAVWAGARDRVYHA